MKALNDWLTLLDGYIGSANWFAFALIGVGLFFTFYLGFPQVRYFRQALRIVRGRFDKPGDEGDTTHFQALATALASTIGTGNIAGVGLAIYIGGPAALFWMLVTAFFGMTTKFVEVTLSHKYREKAADGTMAGGPMYYMAKRLNHTRPNGRTLNTGKGLAVFFAIASVISAFGTGNLPQSNSIATALNATFGIKQWLVGVVLGALLFLVIVGGIKRIAQVTSRLVPAMAAIYIIGAVAVIFNNVENIGPSITNIFSQAFSGAAAVGGFLGAAFNYVFIKGVGRGLFSNEAGMGTAPIAHASAKGHEPVSEGMVALLEPFIDTIIICTLTGLVLLSSGVWSEKHQNTFEAADLVVLAGNFSESNAAEKAQVFNHLNKIGDGLAAYSGEAQVSNGTITSGGFTIIHARSFAEEVRVLQAGAPYTGTLAFKNGALATKGISLEGLSLIHSAPLTAEAFKRGWFGDAGKFIVPLGLLLFAFSTAISSSYYGDRSITFLLGSKSVVYFRVAYVAGFVLASFSDTTLVWNLAAITIALMTLPNLLGITLLHKEMRQTVKDYWADFYQNFPEYKKGRRK